MPVPRLVKSGLYLAAILLMLAFMAGCTSKTTPPPGDATPLAPKTEQEEQRLYQMMEDLAPLEEVTALFVKTLTGADEKVKDRMTSRWMDHAKYRIYEITQDFSINEDGTENDLYAIIQDVFPDGWNASEISKIQNPAQRAYFEILDKSYMKIVQYGDYVGPGFDYERLAALTDLTKGFVSYFELSGAYYQFLKESDETGLIPYVAYTDYLLEFESIRSSATSADLISQLDPLLRWSYGMFFYGSMGSGPLDLETKTFHPVFLERLEAVVSDHPKSALAQLSQAVLALSDQPDEIEYLFYDQVQFFRRFGHDSTKGIRAIYNFKNETLFESRPEFYGFENPDVMNTLNDNLNTLMDGLKEEIKWASDPTASYNLSFYLEFANDRWACFQVAASSFDPVSSVNNNLNRGIIFDLSTGEPAALSDILGDQAEAGLNVIQSIVLEQAKVYQNVDPDTLLDLSKNVSLGDDYVLIMLEPETLSKEQAYPLFIDVRFGKLFPKLDMRTLLMP